MSQWWKQLITVFHSYFDTRFWESIDGLQGSLRYVSDASSALLRVISKENFEGVGKIRVLDEVEYLKLCQQYSKAVDVKARVPELSVMDVLDCLRGLEPSTLRSTVSDWETLFKFLGGVSETQRQFIWGECVKLPTFLVIPGREEQLVDSKDG